MFVSGSRGTPRVRAKRLLGVAVALVALLGAGVGSTAQATPPDGAEGRRAAAGASGLYMVQLAELPVSSYRGGIPGLRATHPGAGRKIDPLATHVVRYADHLKARHDAVLRGVGNGRKVYDYVYAFNGFAAELTAASAAKLASTPGVVSVTKDELRSIETSSTGSFLGLTGNDGFYARTGSLGEDVVIGILDSGVWPESLSFSDRTGENGNASRDGKLDYRQLPGWNGRCVPGDEFNASHCNQKLIGARYYNSGFGGNAGVDAFFPYEYNSPRDADGHGTHTASTAGGNANVPTTGDAAAFGSVSGIAPRARIAAYKVCWGNGNEGGCFNSDSVAAIDQAVADGVDVINFSISGTSTNFLDPVEVAFLFAADAGVFVAASAGNSGPTSSTVAHPSPWITTVAAGTHNRSGEGSVTLGNGATYSGASTALAVGPAPLITSSAAGLPGADPSAAALCFSTADNGGAPVLDPAKVAGKIVVCDRGVTARTSKSLAVQEAGGVGMVLVNTSSNSVNADLHFVPTVHLDSPDRAAVRAYALTEGATATINASTTTFTAPAPFTASFSSRGPLLAGGGDLLKPDIIAPGQDILAAVSPVNYNGRDFDLLSGTSMSSPHIAGIAALFKDLYPTWSPMAIKSAMMTTAGDVLDGGTPAPNTNPILIFRQGAGHVQPNDAINPGVVFDAGFNDWLGFLCGTGQLNASFCPSLRIDPSNLNTASLAIGDLAGTQTVTRKITNVSGRALVLDASVTGMTGLTTTVTPASVSIPRGGTATITVAITRTSAVLNTYAGGQLTLSNASAGGDVDVRVPMVVRPVALAAPATVTGAGAPLSYNVTFGYNGAFTASARGLVPAAVTAGTVADDPTDSACSISSPGAVPTTVTVPAGTTLARFATFDADVTPGADIDICVYGPTGYLASAGGTSSEQVDIVNPSAGVYTVVVQGWGVIGSTPFELNTWLVGSTASGNMTVSAPAVATVPGTGAVSLTFSGLAADTKYLGSVAYAGASGLPNPTVVSVNTP